MHEDANAVNCSTLMQCNCGFTGSVVCKIQWIHVRDPLWTAGWVAKVISVSFYVPHLNW
jgi:hypothetical protein